MSQPQTYANHKRYIPLFHFVALPILFLNVLAHLINTVRQPGYSRLWNTLVAFALAVAVLLVRGMVTRVQDRVIRLEERLRLQRVLPPALQGEIDALGVSDLVALRFASDAEAPELVRRVRSGQLAGRDQIKRAIRDWRPDSLRA